MSAHKTSDEVRQDYIQVMGEDLGENFYLLWDEFAQLHLKWGEYVKLFLTNPLRIDLLNRAAGRFFQILNDSLLKDCLLHIAQLTDPKESCGNENFTIQRLPNLISDERLKQQLKELIIIVKEKVEFCRKLRNKLLAHMDLDIVLGRSVEPLDIPTQAEIENALKAIGDVLNAVHGHYYIDSYIPFEYMKNMPNPRGAEALLYVIEDGLWTEEERNKRLQAGEHRAEDFRNRDI